MAIVTISPRAVSLAGNLGAFFALAGDSLRATFRRPFQFREFVAQVAFISRVSILPAILVAIPFCVVVQFFLGQLLAEIGAIDLAGAGAGFAIIKELGPFCAVMVVAGAGSTSVCADLGARTIREEIDAMKVLGIDPVHRMVVPRILAFVVVSMGLFAIVCAVGILGTFTFSSLLQGASPGLFAGNLTLLVGFDDYLVALFKSALFGLGAGLVCCHLGLNVSGGPKAVGNAVNQSVVFTLMLLMVINSTIGAAYLQLKGAA
jgi:phospholipid/cholesterol/gamma-HCH transport system permease protein